MTDTELMQVIKERMGDYIAGAVEGSAIPASLVAALVANESGGNLAATRFEPEVFGSLARVVAAHKSAFEPAGIKAPIGGSDLLAYICPVRPMAGGQVAQPPATVATKNVSDSILSLINLATSWGPTQIMGWHALEFNFPLGELSAIGTHFDRTMQLLEWFCQKYGITKDVLGPNTMEMYLFHCWNTGQPHGVTADPNYAANGLARMALYEALG